MAKLRFLIILATMALTLTVALVFARPVQSSDTGTIYSIPSHRQICTLPSVENGYFETSPVRCVNTGKVASQQDIQAGIYAAPNAMSQYEYWYKNDAVKIHRGKPCYVLNVDGARLCAGTFQQEATDAQLQDWQQYQASQGGACIYVQPDRCDGEQ